MAGAKHLSAVAPRRGPSRRPAAAAIRVRCPAKVNLGLWILGRRADGYHEVDTFLQAVSLEDELILTPGPPGLALEVRGRAIPGPGPNVIERAFALLEEGGFLPRGAGVRARLTKRIPAGSGLGGGSSDGAGFLVGVERLLGIDLGATKRHALAARLGSDVPFFLRGGLARATGRGDEVRHLCPMKPYWVLLASPATAISTTWAYAQLRYPLTEDRHRATVLASAMERSDLHGVVDAMQNAFEPVILPRLPEVADLKRAISSSGVMGALLSGSGSTVFGVVPSRLEGQAALRTLGGRLAEVRLARSSERGVIVSRLG